MSATQPDGKTPTLESWRTYYMGYGPDVPIPASMSWTGEESQGNPCAIGEVPAPGHEPQEYGLSQLNYEDPANRAIADRAELRAMCGIGPTRHECETVTRPLTEAERIKHAVATIAHIRQTRTIVDQVIGSWPQFSSLAGKLTPDYWRFVKLYHASPVILRYAPVIAHSLGRAPSSFSEFQAHADALALANHVGAGHAGGSRGYLDSVWLNVARVGAAMDAAAKQANA